MTIRTRSPITHRFCAHWFFENCAFFVFVRAPKGVHVLRVEDTDQSRQVEGTLENLLKVLKEVRWNSTKVLY